MYYIKEQYGPAVISEDPKERLKGYLENTELLADLSKQFSSFKAGEITTIKNIDKNKYGIMKDDTLVVRIDKKDPNAPKYFMWIENEKTMYGDVDFSVAANIIRDGIKGMGTYEDYVAGVAGVFIRLAADRNVDPKKYFDKLNDAFNSVGEGESLKDWIEGDFSGRAAVCALNAYQLPIEASVWRGFTDNWLNIVGDLALGFLTLGGSYAFKGVSLVTKTGSLLSKAKGITQGGKLTRGLGKTLELTGAGLSKLLPAQKAFTELPLASKLSGLEKAKYVVGSEWVSSKGASHIIQKIDSGTGRITLKSNASGKVWTQDIDSFISGANVQIATNVLTSAGVLKGVGTTTAAGVTRGTGGAIGSDSSDLEFQGNFLEDTGEFLGYYDAMASDPSKFINSLSTSADEIAQQLKNYKDGTGFWGNTTDQEELAIALTIMNMNRETAKLVAERYNKLAGSNIADLIDDELEYGMAVFASAHWYALTGEGEGEGATKVKEFYSRIVSTSPAAIW